MKPLLRGHFHQAMFFIAFGAGIPLFFRAENLLEKTAIAIYVLCALTMFAVSALYHRINWSPERRQLWRKFDHSSIYLMIAGTFTPISLLGLGGDSPRFLLTIIWTVAFIGILQSLIFVNLPKMVSAVIYLIAGYIIFPYIPELRKTLGDTQVALIITGGVVYSLGALCYGLKRPILNPKIFSYHEVFHLLVNIGAALHFCVINSMIS